jgi:membrane-bound ClpP family serine protease
MEYAWVFILLAAGLLFLLLEVFLPSAGLLLVSGVTALVVSLVLAFRVSPPFGILVIMLIAVLLPLELIIGVKVFPHTPIGKRVVLTPKEKTTVEDRAIETDMASLAGKEGVTITYLRPAGVAEIEGRRVDVVAEGLLIDANRPVKVLRVDGNRVVVREKA